MRNHVEVLLTNGRLIDGSGNEARKFAAIGIREGRIIFIDILPNEIDSNADLTLDLQGNTVLPGIINTHVHAGFKYVNGEVLHDFQKDYLRNCLSEGVTTVRDEGMFTEDTLETVIEKKKLLDEMDQFPRIITTGKFFSAPGGYGGQAPIAIQSVEDVKTHVNHLLDLGIDMVKTVLEDGMDPSTFGLPKLSDELLTAICQQAHQRNVKVSAHVTEAHNLRRLVDAGIDDAGHMVYDELPDDLITEMIVKNVRIVPTLTIYKMFQDRFGLPLLKHAQANVKRFVDAGGKIALGNDYIEELDPWYVSGLPYLELQLLKESGLTERQILQAATKNGAEVCNLAHDLGTIEVGKIADLLIVRGNPDLNLEDIRKVMYVLTDGKIVQNNSII